MRISNQLLNPMRKLLFVLLLISGKFLLAQDTTVTWMYTIDPATFTVQYDKKNIPEEFFSILGVESVSDIANPGKPYQKRCTSVRDLPHKRLNWIASDSTNHWVLSISYGGRGSGTLFYFIDKENGKLNTNQFHLHAADPEKLNLAGLCAEIKAKRFWRIQVHM